jgi:Kdo2-lipid IVA lauroyltransferase/acyltransferase
LESGLVLTHHVAIIYIYFLSELSDIPVDEFMITAFLKLPARLPLSWFHGVGIVVGWLVYWVAPSYAKQVRENLYASGVCSNECDYRATLAEAVRETGKMATEWIKIWFASPADFNRMVVECHGWTLVEEARRRGKGIIFLLPHLGSFQIALRYIAARLPLTALYRPPRQRWRQPFQMAGSSYAGLSMASTDFSGVQKIYKALARGEAVALPPDQAPNSRGGVWADFFGRPAYTMTLPKKLQHATGAALIAAYAERLNGGKGFRLEFQSVEAENFDERGLNQIVEDLVRHCPGQYLWSYNRYKVPRKSEVKRRKPLPSYGP